MALFASVEGCAAERDALIDGAAVPDFGRLSYHHAHAVIDEHAASDSGPRMDLDSSEPAAEVRSKAPQPTQPTQPEPVRELVDVDRMEARIAGEHFPCAARGRVAVENAGDVGAQLREHEGHIRVSDCFDQLFAAHFPSNALRRPRMMLTSSRSSAGTREKSRRQRSRRRDPLAMKLVCRAASSRWA